MAKSLKDLADEVEKHGIFKRWAEIDEKDYPIADWEPWRAPRYTQKTLTEHIEPWYSQWRELQWELPYDRAEGPPDPEFYAPTPKLLDLEERIDALADKAFREVPNPDYDEARATEYWEKQRARLNQTTYYIGQSYNPIP